MSRSTCRDKENVPPKRRIPWFKHHNPGTRYSYDGPRQPKVQVLSSVVVVPRRPTPLRSATNTHPEPGPSISLGDPNVRPTPSTPRRPKPATGLIPQTPRRPKSYVPIPETPRPARSYEVPRRRLPVASPPRRHPTPARLRRERSAPRSRTHQRSSRSHAPSDHRPREKSHTKPRFRPPPPRSPSPPRRIVITRDRGMRPDIPWVAPRRLNLIKPSRPRFHDVTGRDPRSRAVQVVVTLPPLDRPIRRPGTPPTPHTSPVPSPVRPLPATPPCIKVPGPLPKRKIVYYRGSLVPGRPRRHISLEFFEPPRTDPEVRE